MNENNLSGALIINKPKGITSHDVVGKIRRLYGIRRVGHTGTLDPLACGVLPVLIGRASIAAELLLNEDKRYIAHMRLGITTDTEDITGNILSESDNIPDKEEVIKVCDSFKGEIEQVPPMYSALKVGGKKLVDLARKGIEVERSARKVTIYSIDASPDTQRSDTYVLDVRCSKGTYIRTLCADIGKKLGCGAVMSELCRASAGIFDISESVSIDELEQMTPDERINKIIPTENLFSDLNSVMLPSFYSRLAHNGAEIYQKKIKTDFQTGTLLKMYDENGFFAVGRVDEYENGSAIHVLKLFVL